MHVEGWTRSVMSATVMSEVRTIQTNAAHPRGVASRAGPPDPTGACHPGNVVVRRLSVSMVQSVHGSRHPLTAHPRAPPPAAGRVPHSRRRASIQAHCDRDRMLAVINAGLLFLRKT